jgi:ribonucleases P/MRP protein subunit RPP40
VDSGVPHGSILGPLLFIIFINGIDEGLMSDILKFANDTQIFGKAGTKDCK